MGDLTALDAANRALQADAKAAATVKRYAAANTAVLHAMQPPPTGSGLGLLMYRGNLVNCSHLTDGTYELVIASWGDPVLPSVSGEKYAYTVVAGTPGADPATYTVLDPANPVAYLLRTATLPPGVGVFLDNTLYTIPPLLAALQTVSAGLKQQGRKLCVNAGAFIPGDLASNDGTLWATWAAELVPYVDRIMLEHWQAVYLNAGTSPPGNGETLRARGNAWTQMWDQWQKVVAACAGKFVGITYAGSAGLPNAIYARASLLLAGHGVFIYSTGDGSDTGSTDPYDPAWAKANPVPVVNPVAPVSASL